MLFFDWFALLFVLLLFVGCLGFLGAVNSVGLRASLDTMLVSVFYGGLYGL